MNEKLCELYKEIFDWGYSDAEYLEGVMIEYDLEPQDVVEKMEDIFGYDVRNIDHYIYSALQLGADAIKWKLVDWFPKYEDQIWSFDERIYVNGLDSGFDSVFAEYDYRDLDDKETALELLAEMLGEDKEDLRKELESE